MTSPAVPAAWQPPPTEGERIYYECPSCGRPDANATFTSRYGPGDWFIGCWSDTCRGPEHLQLLADALGTTAAELKLDPRPFLSGGSNGEATHRREGAHDAAGWIAGDCSHAPGPWVWRPDQWVGWQAQAHQDLLRGRGCATARAYLAARGLGLRAIRRFRLGYSRRGAPPPYRDWAGFTWWVRTRHGQPYVLRRRLWPNVPTVPRGAGERQVRYCGPAGVQAQLWPVLAPGRVLLVGGELDALLCCDRGLPAMAATCGASLPGHLLPGLDGYHVCVIYDAGEQGAARRTAALLRTMGVQAWAADLERAGLQPGEDLTDLLVQRGWSTGQLRAWLRAQRAGQL